MVSLFQSYLIVGREEARRQKTTQLAKSLVIDLGKTSPDIFVISPIRTAVTIDQVRDLKRHIFQKPVQDKFKFVLIEQAEKLTIEAQNALLKILEEPPTHAIIVLEAHDKTALLSTIRSRVITIQAAFSPHKLGADSILLQTDLHELLTQIAQVENAPSWLDEQMITLYTKLKEDTAQNLSTSKAVCDTIEKCAQAKQMIAANLNPKFVLAHLIFSTWKVE